MRKGLLVASMFLCAAVIALATAARGQGQGASVPERKTGHVCECGAHPPAPPAIAM